MHTDKNLQFITTKILDTTIALLHCHNNSLLKIPSQVIQTYKVDDDGCIWFFMPRPKQVVSQFEQEFPVNLHYFKKGNPYSMNIYGKANIINDPEDLVTIGLEMEQIEQALNNQLLISVKILKVDYFDHDQEKGNNFWNRIRLAVYELLDWAEGGNKSYEFNPAPGVHHYGF